MKVGPENGQNWFFVEEVKNGRILTLENFCGTRSTGNHVITCRAGCPLWADRILSSLGLRARFTVYNGSCYCTELFLAPMIM